MYDTTPINGMFTEKNNQISQNFTGWDPPQIEQVNCPHDEKVQRALPPWEICHKHHVNLHNYQHGYPILHTNL
jgi:hypothetical protein